MKLQDYIRISSYTRELREEEKQSLKQFEEEHPDLLKQWVGIALGYNEYADGITGVHYFGRMVLENENSGFKLKGAVRKTLLEHGVHIGKMKKEGKAMSGGWRHSGWDILKLFKVPDMIAWMKEHNRFYRLYYSGWENHGPIVPKVI